MSMSDWKLNPSVLLSENIPLPLHGMNPRTVLGSKWWNKTRGEAYASTNYRCASCGVHKLKAKFHHHLEGHELYQIDYELGIMEYLETVPLCHACHCYIHDGRLRAQLTKNELSHSRYAAIIDHGDQVLSQARLVRKSKLERDKFVETKIILGEYASWTDWKLSIQGTEYSSPYTTAQDYIDRWNTELSSIWKSL